MTRTARISNIGAVIVPFVAFWAAVLLLWNEVVGWTDLGVLAIMYLLTGFGVTIGFHRMLTHRAFQTSKPVEYAFATLGSMAVQGPVINWVADHRKHHAHTDEEGDPHSPHGHGAGSAASCAGLYHAHIGWLFSEHGQARRMKYAPDLMEDPGMRRIHKSFVTIVLAGLALPALLGFVLSGWSWRGALTGLLWGGLVRIFLLHHVTWSINSVCHFFGTRRFATEDESRNVFWLALPELRRGLAPQPPRLPALGDARPAPRGARPVGLGHRRHGAARARLERRADRARAPGAAPRRPPAG